MSPIIREVEKAPDGDVGRSIARLDPKTLLDLDMEPGDILLIEGESTTTAKAWRLARKEWDRGIVRIDGFLQENAGVERFDEVRLQRIEPRPADQVVVAPSGGSADAGKDMRGDWLQRQLTKHVVTSGDTLPVRNSYHSMTQTPVTELPQVTVMETSANQPVIITEDTELTVEV